MITEETLIPLLFQIGFCEQEEHEITFTSFEEKLDYRRGEKRFFKNINCIFDIDYNLRRIKYTCIYLEKDKHSRGMNLSLDNMEDVFKALNEDFNHELRKIKISNLLNGGN